MIVNLVFEYGCAHLSKIIEQTKRLGMSEKSVQKLLMELKREGIVYELRENCFALVL